MPTFASPTIVTVAATALGAAFVVAEPPAGATVFAGAVVAGAVGSPVGAGAAVSVSVGAVAASVGAGVVAVSVGWAAASVGAAGCVGSAEATTGVGASPSTAKAAVEVKTPRPVGQADECHGRAERAGASGRGGAAVHGSPRDQVRSGAGS